MNILIPARGGSKRIHRKNMAIINGAPLLYYTIRAAKKIEDRHNIYVSSDDDEILLYAKDCGVQTIRRDPELCSDTVYAIEIWKDFIRNNPSEYSAYMQPTTPYRDIKNLREEIPEFIRTKQVSGFSAYKFKGFVHRTDDKVIFRERERVRSQALKHSHLIEDGGFYMAKNSELLYADDLWFTQSPFIFSSLIPIDIDESLDLENARKYNSML